MDLGIAGKNAIVCASSKGLGKACALALAREGVNVWINGRHSDTLEQAAAEITAAGGGAVHTVLADVTAEAGREALLAACPAPDVVVNNAGGPPPGDFRDWRQQDWFDAVNNNMYSAIDMIRRCLDGMMERRFGRIVNITSVAVKMPVPTLGLSNGARAGLTGFVSTIARDPAQHNLFRLPTDVGLSAVLADEAEVVDAIQPSGVPGLDVLPCGAAFGSPGELLASPRFQELLDYVRERFHVAIIDTAPVLAVSDPLVVAPFADGMLLVLRNSRKARTLITRVQSLMDPLDVSLLGVILNQLDYDDSRSSDGHIQRRFNGSHLEHLRVETEAQEAPEIPVGGFY